MSASWQEICASSRHLAVPYSWERRAHTCTKRNHVAWRLIFCILSLSLFHTDTNKKKNVNGLLSYHIRICLYEKRLFWNGNSHGLSEFHWAWIIAKSVWANNFWENTFASQREDLTSISKHTKWSLVRWICHIELTGNYSFWILNWPYRARKWHLLKKFAVCFFLSLYILCLTFLVVGHGNCVSAPNLMHRFEQSYF